jgi:hypothetical protein
MGMVCAGDHEVGSSSSSCCCSWCASRPALQAAVQRLLQPVS